MSTFFSSDFHLGHKNILKLEYDNRPFKTVEEMDEAIINNHNSVVNNNDNFYYLGDFCLNRFKAEEYMKRLNGRKFFIKGNHDHDNIRKLYTKYGTYLGYMDEIKIEGQLITLCHYRCEVWNKSHRGSWHLYGHSHHSLLDNPHALSIDVGVNGWNYFPASFECIKRIMETKDYKPVDHHI